MMKGPDKRCNVLQRALLVVALLGAAPVGAAYTEPRLALMRVTPYHAAAGATTLKLEGSFSFADSLQLGLPLSITITQGQLSARFDLAGNVFTRDGAGPEQSAAGPGVLEVAQRQITLVLPPGFATGAATAQVVATYESRAIASNRLGFSL